MNYALDAIWWQLRHPAVRDLAALLTAPPLWHSGCELPARRLLGSHGFRYLLYLDGHTTPLQQWLEQEAPFAHRLGRYAESLLAFWLKHAPHIELLARNLPLYNESRQTLGAADFICLIDQEPWHLELTCKYYGSSRNTADFHGLNPNDLLSRKTAKLQQQCSLLQQPAAQSQLPPQIRSYLKTYGQLRAASVIRGIGFTPNGILHGKPLNPLGWSGLYLQHWLQYDAPPQQRFHWLPRLGYLSPARIRIEQTLSAAELAQQPGGLAAVIEQRPDGMWHEILRLMCPHDQPCRQPRQT